jgi:hypothetical protein
MERETGVQSVLSTSGNAVTAGNDDQLLPLGFVGSFSKSHSTFEGWKTLLWNRPQNIVSSFSLSATFPLVSGVLARFPNSALGELPNRWQSGPFRSHP